MIDRAPELPRAADGLDWTEDAILFDKMIVEIPRRPDRRALFDERRGAPDMIDMAMRIDERADGAGGAGEERISRLDRAIDVHPGVDDDIPIRGADEDDIAEIVANGDEDALAYFDDARFADDLATMRLERLFGRDSAAHGRLLLHDPQLHINPEAEG